MDEREELERVQRLLAAALIGGVPDALEGGAEELPEAMRAALANIDRGGLQIAILLVAKLRFQRLMNGSSRANEWWQRDQAGFTEAFRHYHRDVPPTGSDPWTEAAQFERWVEGQSADLQ